MPTRTFRSWPIVMGLVLVVLAIFAPVLSNEFVNWDDDLNLTENPAYRGLSPAHLRWMFTTLLGGHYQPLTWLSFAIDHALWGMDPRGYHLMNLLLHAGNAVLVWLVLRRLLTLATNASEATVAKAAAVGALFFAVHPLRVESVAWATERRDVLSGCFWLVALLFYLRAATAPAGDRRPGMAAALVALVASLLAKAWGMTFPLVLLILDAYPLRRLGRAPSAVLREKLPFAFAAGVAALIAITAQRGVPDMRTLGEHGPIERLAQAAYGLGFYLVATVAPVDLYPAHLLELPLDPTHPRYVAAALAVLAITTAAVVTRRRWPGLLAAFAAYVVIVAPVSGLAQAGPQLVADRYTYLACLPWAALVAGAAVGLWSPGRGRVRRGFAGAATGGALLALAVLTHRQTTVWHDSITLWNHTLRHDPTNWIAHTNRGWAVAASDPAAAIADYSAAIASNPRYSLAYFNRGNARHQEGDYIGAAADHSVVIALLPDDPRAYNNRGWAREALSDWAGAAADYEHALALAPPDWWAREMVTGNLAAVRARISANDR